MTSPPGAMAQVPLLSGLRHTSFFHGGLMPLSSGR